jgi:hypothetical protein
MRIKKFNESIALSKLNHISQLVFRIWKDEFGISDVYLSEHRDGIYFNFRFNFSYLSYDKWKVLFDLLQSNKIEWVLDEDQPQFCIYFVNNSNTDKFLNDLEMLTKSNKYNL